MFLSRLNIRPSPGLRQQLLEHFEEDYLLYDVDQLAKLVGALEVLGVTSGDSAWLQLLTKTLGTAAQGCDVEEEVVVLQQLVDRVEGILIPLEVAVKV